VATAISWLDVANQIVQLIAGIVAIISGAAAAWYYIKSNRRIKEQPKDYGPED
jgi:anti-sigma factor RsiW